MLLHLNIDLKIKKGEHPIEGANAFTACKSFSRLTRGMR